MLEVGHVLVVGEIVLEAVFRDVRDGVVGIARIEGLGEEIASLVLEVAAAHAVESFRGNDLVALLVVGVED